MCELVVRHLLTDGPIRINSPLPQCVSEYSQLTGVLLCTNPVAWTLTQDFMDSETAEQYRLRIQICNHHFNWHFIQKNFRCSVHHEPYTVVDVTGRVLS